VAGVVSGSGTARAAHRAGLSRKHPSHHMHLLNLFIKKTVATEQQTAFTIQTWARLLTLQGVLHSSRATCLQTCRRLHWSWQQLRVLADAVAAACTTSEHGVALRQVSSTDLSPTHHCRCFSSSTLNRYIRMYIRYIRMYRFIVVGTRCDQGYQHYMLFESRHQIL
jgi:hypothetical protein